MTRPVKRLGKRTKAQKEALEKVRNACALKRKKSSSLDDSGILTDGEGEPAHSSQTTSDSKRIKPARTIEATKVLTGRRILSLASIGFGLSECISHGRMCVHGETTGLEKETLEGLKCTLVFGCICGWKTIICSDSSEETLPINTALPWACISTPLGYDAMTAFFSTLDIPTPSHKVLHTIQDKAGSEICRASEIAMKLAGEEEKRIATEKGNYVEVGGVKYPSIAVQNDAFWQKRSWGHSYNSNYGAAAIIGCETKKVLFCGIRQKTCFRCSMASRKGNVPSVHSCVKNWDKASTAMESSIIVEGFQKSISSHGLVYECFIGDGDASVHAALLNANIYDGFRIRKIECTNHLIRNLNTKLRNIATNKVKGRMPAQISREDRARPGMENRFGRVGLAVHGAASYYNRLGVCRDNINMLANDICNIPYHIFGQHAKCQDYFCKREGTEENLVPTIRTTALWQFLIDAVQRVANNAESLIERKSSNLVETFASVVNKYIDGKRINLGGGNLYKFRLASAVLAFNTASYWPAKCYEILYSSEASITWTKRQTYSTNRRRNIKHKKLQPRSFKFGFLRQGDKHYGSNPMKPDLPEDQLISSIERFRQSLTVDKDGQLELEELTRLQSDNERWFKERKSRITASKCGQIFKMRATTANTNILKDLLGARKFQSLATDYGKQNEGIARLKYEDRKGFPRGMVKDVGLFVSLEDGIFGASPDGLVEDDGILEIKCPFSIKDSPPTEWIKKKDSPIYLEKDGSGKYKLKERHNFYYQIVMQLHVTNRAWCDFVIYTKIDVLIIRIVRDDNTLKVWQAMKPVLEKFWKEDLAPELVDSRIERGLAEYRSPPQRKSGKKVLGSRIRNVRPSPVSNQKLN